jgi:hypothetical protein
MMRNILFVIWCGLIGAFSAANTGCLTVSIVHVGDNESSTAANVATSRSAASEIGGSSNTVDAVEVEGSGGLDAVVPLSGTVPGLESIGAIATAVTNVPSVTE